MNHQKILEEFEKAIDTVDGIYNGDIKGGTLDTYDDLNEYLKSDENKLFMTDCYPESPWELEPEKVKAFLSQALSDKDKAVEAVIEGEIARLKEYPMWNEFVKGEHQALTDLLQLLNPKE